MKKVGILGGTFNPPHCGHLAMAKRAKEALDLDEVRLMPNATPPHKTTRDDVTAAQRWHMVQLATEGLSSIIPFDYEIKRGGTSYTYDTMRSLVKEEPHTQFYFIIGSDMIDTLHTWYEIEALSELVTFVGMRRHEREGETAYPIIRIPFDDVPISSTLIRERIRNGQSVRGLVPSQVERWMKEEGLYEVRSDEEKSEDVSR